MFQTNAFGHTYAAAGPASVGTRIYDAQVQAVSFARSVELQKLRLEKRRLNMQEAQMAASRAAAERNFELSETRFELERQRLEMDDADRQQRREMAMQQFQQTMADRQEAREFREREFQARQQEAQDAREFRRSEAEFSRNLRQEELDWQRKYRQMTLEDRREDRETRRAQQELTRGQYEASQAERQRAAAETARHERNNILQAGGYELKQGEEPRTGYRLYEGPEGRRYAVPITQQKQPTEKKPQYTPATIDKAMGRVDSLMAEYADAIKTGDDGASLLDDYEASFENPEEGANARRAIDDLLAKNGRATYDDVRGAVATDAQKRDMYFDVHESEAAAAARTASRQKAVQAMSAYKSAAYLNNDLLRAMPPNFVADIEWTELPAEAVDDFMKYLNNGVFDNHNMNILMKQRLIDAAKEEKQRRAAEKKKAEERQAERRRVWEEARRAEKRQRDEQDKKNREATWQSANGLKAL